MPNRCRRGTRALISVSVQDSTTAPMLLNRTSVRCESDELVQFAIMGGVYARVALGVSAPRVGLLSIGEEETKGTELTREAHKLLEASSLNFVGNVEARDIFSGQADVIVCDGFTGNVALKLSEGLVEIGYAPLPEDVQTWAVLGMGDRRYDPSIDCAICGA